MIIWHNTGDASRIPEHVTSGDDVVLWIGSHPIEPDQTVWVEMTLVKPSGKELTATQPATWHSNNEHRNNSYWQITIGSFEQGDHLEYRVFGGHGDERVTCNESFSFDVS